MSRAASKSLPGELVRPPRGTRETAGSGIAAGNSPANVRSRAAARRSQFAAKSAPPCSNGVPRARLIRNVSSATYTCEPGCVKTPIGRSRTGILFFWILRPVAFAANPGFAIRNLREVVLRVPDAPEFSHGSARINPGKEEEM